MVVLRGQIEVPASCPVWTTISCVVKVAPYNSQTDMDHDTKVIRITNGSRRGIREIGWKVSHYSVREGGGTSCRNPGWEVYGLGQTSGVLEDLC